MAVPSAIQSSYQVTGVCVSCLMVLMGHKQYKEYGKISMWWASRKARITFLVDFSESIGTQHWHWHGENSPGSSNVREPNNTLQTVETGYGCQLLLHESHTKRPCLLQFSSFFQWFLDYHFIVGHQNIGGSKKTFELLQQMQRNLDMQIEMWPE